MTNLVLFMTDPHGIQSAYERTLEHAVREGISTIILGGDLLPKRIAIKLPRTDNYETEDEADDETTSEDPSAQEPSSVIFTPDMIDLDPVSQTYLPSIEQINRLNIVQTPAALEAFFRATGHVIREEQNRFYSFDTILADQQLFDRILQFYKERERTGTRSNVPIFSDEELDLLRDILSDNYSSRRLDEGQKQINARIWKAGIKKNLPECILYEDLCPERNLVDFFRYANRAEALCKELNELAKGLQETSICTEARTLAGQHILSLAERIGISSEVGYLYSHDEVFSILQKHIKESAEGIIYKVDKQHDEIIREGQQEFMNGYLRNWLARLKQASPAIKVYAILGNDDMVENEAIAKEFDEQKLWTYVHQKKVLLPNGHVIVGYNCVPQNTRFYSGWHKTDEEIGNELLDLTRDVDGKKLVLVTHCPPHNTDLDLAHGDEHIGSVGIKYVITTREPVVSFHGHVHESFAKTGKVAQQIGRTWSFNPGGFYQKEHYCGVIVDIDDPAGFISLTTQKKEGS